MFVFSHLCALRGISNQRSPVVTLHHHLCWQGLGCEERNWQLRWENKQTQPKGLLKKEPHTQQSGTKPWNSQHSIPSSAAFRNLFFSFLVFPCHSFPFLFFFFDVLFISFLLSLFLPFSIFSFPFSAILFLKWVLSLSSLRSWWLTCYLRSNWEKYILFFQSLSWTHFELSIHLVLDKDDIYSLTFNLMLSLKDR